MPTPVPIGTDKQLWQRLDQAGAEALTPLSRDDVSVIVEQIVGSLAGDFSATDLKLYHELEALARYIQHTRSEVAALRPDEISSSHIPNATDELDAVVGATETATNTIMDGCDAIAAIAGRLDAETGQALTEIVTRVFEACNFQDITGQRITKVVRALKHIEAKVDALVVAFGEQAGAPASVRPVAVAAAPAMPTTGAKPGDADSHLMHGPSLPGQAIDQDEIDRLLASFD